MREEWRGCQIRDDPTWIDAKEVVWDELVGINTHKEMKRSTKKTNQESLNEALEICENDPNYQYLKQSIASLDAEMKEYHVCIKLLSYVNKLKQIVKRGNGLSCYERSRYNMYQIKLYIEKIRCFNMHLGHLFELPDSEEERLEYERLDKEQIIQDDAEQLKLKRKGRQTTIFEFLSNETMNK